MKYENLSWTDALAIRAEQFNHPHERLRFSGTDLGDHYAIIEDWTRHNVDNCGHADHYLLFWLSDEPESPHSSSCHTTMIEAMLMLARRFNLDNCDGADTKVPEVKQRHDELESALKHLVNY